jgi:hypothetical protein
MRDVHEIMKFYFPLAYRQAGTIEERNGEIPRKWGEGE